MKKFIVLFLALVLIFINENNIYAKQSTEDIQQTGFSSEIEDENIDDMVFNGDRMAREYARQYTGTINVSLGKEKTVAKISVVLKYSYTDSRVVISSFSCAQTYIKNGNKISIEKKEIQNGNPAIASVRYTATNPAAGQSRTFIAYFAVRTNGDVRTQIYPLN